MRILGIILVVAGILLFILHSVSFKQEKEVAQIGPVEINKTETKSFRWPSYTGGIVMGAGIILILVAKKKKG